MDNLKETDNRGRIIFLKYFWNFLTSMKTAVVLISVIIVLCSLATFVLQGKDDQFYLETYPNLGPLILAIGFNHFFRSILFFIITICFFINLLLCTGVRLFRRLKKGVPFRPGPDIIHIGILLIIVGGTISLRSHQEAFVWLREGEYFTLPGGNVKIKLKEFSFHTYPDGRPKDWISHVEIFDQDIGQGDFFIEVNKPLSVGQYKVYQSSYSYEPDVHFSYKDKNFVVSQGEGFQFQEVGYFVESIRNAESEEPVISFILMEGEVSVEDTKTIGETVGDFTIESIEVTKKTGLQVSSDKGDFIIIIALILLTAGLFVTFYQKLGDQKE